MPNMSPRIFYLLLCLPLVCHCNSWQELELVLRGMTNKLGAIVNRLYRHEVRSRVVDDVIARAVQAITAATSDHTVRVQRIEVKIDAVQSQLAQMETKTAKENRRFDEILLAVASMQKKITKMEISNRLSSDDRMEMKQRFVDQTEANNNISHQLTAKLDRLLNQTQQENSDRQNMSLLLANLSERYDALESTAHKLISTVRNTSSASVSPHLTHSSRSANQSLYHNGWCGHMEDVVRNVSRKIDDRQTLYQDTMTDKLERVDGAVNVLFRTQTAHESRWLALAKKEFEAVKSNFTLELSTVKKLLSDFSRSEVLLVQTSETVIKLDRHVQFVFEQLQRTIEKTEQDIYASLSSAIALSGSRVTSDLAQEQSRAVQNITLSIGEEMAGIWRQIGVMYEVLMQSVHVLQSIDSRTAQHINGSLLSAEKMGGTVSHVARKVDDVEDNLNFLLGRLSLVVSEFDHLRSGIDHQMSLMKDRFGDISSHLVQRHLDNAPNNDTAVK